MAKYATREEALEAMRKAGITVTHNDPSRRPAKAEIIASPRKQYREYVREAGAEPQRDQDN
jgi:hypothetical protein